MEFMKTTMSANILLLGGASQDTSGSPLEGGEAVPIGSTRCTTTQPTHRHPPHPTKMNEIDLYSYLPAHIYLAFGSAFDSRLVFYRITTPHASSNGRSLLSPYMLSFELSVRFAYRYLVIP